MFTVDFDDPVDTQAPYMQIMASPAARESLI